VASWASIDYYGRYKALQYYAKRFYNPILISCCETGERETRPCVNTERTVDYQTKAQLAVTNDTLESVTGTVLWELRNTKNEIIKNGSEEITVEPQSVFMLTEIDFNKCDVNTIYLYYRLVCDNNTVGEGSVLFTAPKYFNFESPNLRYEIRENEITVFADKYAKSVEIDSPDSDFVLSDNYFDMNAGSKTVKILDGIPKTISLRSVYDIR